jgi:hypothetical protein
MVRARHARSAARRRILPKSPQFFPLLIPAALRGATPTSTHSGWSLTIQTGRPHALLLLFGFGPNRGKLVYHAGTLRDATTFENRRRVEPRARDDRRHRTPHHAADVGRAPHTWHAAEAVLYLLELDGKTSHVMSNKPARSP